VDLFQNNKTMSSTDLINNIQFITLRKLNNLHTQKSHNSHNTHVTLTQLESHVD